jgi:hypothetical protein
MEEETGTVETTEVETSENTEVVEAAEASEQEETVEVAEDPTKKEKGVQKRINELTAARHKAENDAEYWRKVAAGEIRPAQAAQPQADFIPQGYPAEPKLEGFEDYDQYNRALVRWEAGRLLAERDHAAEQGKIREAKQSVGKAHNDRVGAAREKYADYDEVFSTASDMNMIQSTFDAVIESDQSADIGYHLAKNPAEFVRLNGLSPVQQIKEIARLEDKFRAVPVAPVKRVSQAPVPITPISGGGEASANGKEPDASVNPQAWSAWEAARVKKLGRRY